MHRGIDAGHEERFRHQIFPGIFQTLGSPVFYGRRERSLLRLLRRLIVRMLVGKQLQFLSGIEPEDPLLQIIGDFVSGIDSLLAVASRIFPFAHLYSGTTAVVSDTYRDYI